MLLLLRSLTFILLVFFTTSTNALPFISTPFDKNDITLTAPKGVSAAVEKMIIDNINNYRTQLDSLELSISLQAQRKTEITIITKVLHAHGLYQFDIEPTYIKKKLRFNVKSKAQYRVSHIDYGNLLDLAKHVASDMPLQKNKGLTATKVLDTVSQLQAATDEYQCFFENKIDYSISLNHNTFTAEVTFFRTGTDDIYAGELTITGLTTVKRPWMREKFGIEAGDCLSRSRFNQAILNLYTSNVIARVEHNTTLRGNIADIELILTERKHKTISFGLGLSTGQGVYGNAGWQHRSVLGQGETVKADTYLSLAQQSIEGQLLLPNTRFLTGVYELSGSLDHEINSQTEFYQTAAQFLIKFQMSPAIQLRTGVRLSTKFTQELDADEGDFVTQLRLPNLADIDYRNDVLNATSGLAIHGQFTPVFDLKTPELSYIDYRWGIKSYFGFDVPSKPTIAIKYDARLISVEGDSEIPFEEKVILGGNGSLRGFPFKSIDNNGEGGLSRSSVSLELRNQYNESFGTVIFADFAQMRSKTDVYSEEPWYTGLGVGLRYFTSFAPIRLDLALPYPNFPNADEDYSWGDVQYYISIGQAF